MVARDGAIAGADRMGPSKIVNALSFRLLGAALFFFLAVSAQTADKSPPSMPKRFKAFIGGFLGASYRIELRDDGILECKNSGRRSGDAEHTKIKPTLAEWREFRAALDALNVWKWQPEFSSNGVADGTQWSLDIAYADRALTSQGSNNYPDAHGKPNRKPEMTPAFSGYLAAVRKLTGGRSFE